MDARARYCYNKYMRLHTCLIAPGCLLLSNLLCYAGSLTGQPTIDFGSASFVAGSSSGFKVITMAADGSTSTSTSGELTAYISGTAGSAQITPGTLERIFGSTITFQTDRNTSATTITTAGCGSVSISNFRTTGNSTSATARSSSDPSSFPVGATLTLTSFTGNSCTISGTVTGPVQFKIGTSWMGGTDWTDVPVNITIFIQRRMSLEHDTSAALNFGTICTSNAQQTITVAADGSTSSTNARCPLTGTSADSFTVTGGSGQSFSITLPATATISNGSNSLTISNLTSPCTSSCTLSSTSYTVTVGGTLTIPANPAVGNYQGTYTVNMTY